LADFGVALPNPLPPSATAGSAVVAQTVPLLEIADEVAHLCQADPARDLLDAQE